MLYCDIKREFTCTAFIATLAYVLVVANPFMFLCVHCVNSDFMFTTQVFSSGCVC